MRHEQGESERRSLAMNSTSPAEDIGYVVGQMIGTVLCLGVMIGAVVAVIFLIIRATRPTTPPMPPGYAPPGYGPPGYQPGAAVHPGASPTPLGPGWWQASDGYFYPPPAPQAPPPG
jgi:hypothetical protein